MKNGFTLVELSIVLVIIGLLIGGILVGQSLIDSTKINAQIRQISQFNIAVQQFKAKFRSLPGDSKLFDDAGDEDGLIKEIAGFPTSDNFEGEVSNFWKHLSEGGFKPENVIYSNDAASGIELGVNLPEATYEGSGVATYGITGSSNGNFFLIGGFSETDSSLIPFAYSSSVMGAAIAMPVWDAISIDTKVDDGIAWQGNVIMGHTGVNPAAMRFAGCTDQFGSRANYSTTATDEDGCVLSIKMDDSYSAVNY